MFILWLRKLARLFCIVFLFLFLSDIGQGILKKGKIAAVLEKLQG